MLIAMQRAVLMIGNFVQMQIRILQNNQVRLTIE
jgi:hypothetical protein